MSTLIHFIGLDVHKESVAVSIAPAHSTEVATTRKVTNRIANILRMAANALSRAQGRMGEYVRRFKGRLGKAEGHRGRSPQTGADHLGDDRERPTL